MEGDLSNNEGMEKETKNPEVVYKSEKDFYRGMSGELRFKAEGLFKKAKEKGISIEDIEIEKIRENQAEFPGLGLIDLPAFIIKVRGRHLQSGQVMVDGKQIDYYNIYQKYSAEKIEKKNILRDEAGRVVKQNNRAKYKEEPELNLNDWERFLIGKSIVDDKEFGIEKTITGACDRIIRKLMGENDWLSPGEARLLDEEFQTVQTRIIDEQENRKEADDLERQVSTSQKKATERQINYLKARIKNSGVDPDEDVIREVIKQSGFNAKNIRDLTTGDMSKIIDSVNIVIPRIKEALAKRSITNAFAGIDNPGSGENIKQ